MQTKHWQKSVTIIGINKLHTTYIHTRTCTRTHTNHFTVLLDFVWDYLGELAPER